MTRDDIIRLYLQVSSELCENKEWCWHGAGEPLQRFAALVAAAEREACAKVCEDSNTWDLYDPNGFAANLIRARGQA